MSVHAGILTVCTSILLKSLMFFVEDFFFLGNVQCFCDMCNTMNLRDFILLFVLFK